MDADSIITTAEEGMAKALDFTLGEFASIHTGKASPSMVDGISVDVYGSSMKLRDIAAITTPDTRLIMIQPWDQGVVKEIEKAIIAANIGFNPSAMGTSIRVPVPELSRDRRQELVKVANGHAEEGRVRIRGARRDAMDGLKKLEKEKEISEDDRKRYEKDVQKLTDDHVAKIASSLKAKEQELLTV
ncbi:MAG: ribosome recycling factor [Opitutales bacterium]